MARTVLLVGSKTDTLELVGLLAREGITVIPVHEPREAFEEAQRVKPTAIAIIIPQYYVSVMFFIRDIRATPEFKNIPIYYMGELIEGGDLKTLKAMDVRVISIGPVPFSEVIRQMVDELR